MPIWLGLALGKAWDFVKQVPLYIWIISVLVLSNLFTLHEWQHTSANLKTEKALHATDIKNFKDAQAQANINAKAIEDKLIKESKANAAQADATYSTLLGQYRASLLRYRTNQSTAQQTNSDQLPTPKGGDGPSESPQLPATLEITSEDAETCAVNTARLQAVHDWAVSLPKP